MTSRSPRPATPAPTVPPPELASERLVKRLESWKALVALAVLLLCSGAAFAAWQRNLATTDDVDKVQTAAAAQLGAVQGTTATQLGALQAQVQDLRARQAAVEGRLEDLFGISERLFDQTIEIAKTTGARRVPPPASHPP